MIDVKKLNYKIKIDIILLWLESLSKKEISSKEKEAISLMCDFILEEVSR